MYCEKYFIIVYSFCELLKHIMMVWIFLAAVMPVIEHLVTNIVEDCRHSSIMPWLMHWLLFLPYSLPPSAPLSSYQPYSSLFSFMATLTLCVCVCVCARVRACVCMFFVYWHFQNLKLADLFCIKTTTHYLLDLEEVSSMIEQYCWIDWRYLSALNSVK